MAPSSDGGEQEAVPGVRSLPRVGLVVAICRPGVVPWRERRAHRTRSMVCQTREPVHRVVLRAAAHLDGVGGDGVPFRQGRDAFFEGSVAMGARPGGRRALDPRRAGARRTLTRHLITPPCRHARSRAAVASNGRDWACIRAGSRYSDSRNRRSCRPWVGGGEVFSARTLRAARTVGEEGVRQAQRTSTQQVSLREVKEEVERRRRPAHGT